MSKMLGKKDPVNKPAIAFADHLKIAPAHPLVDAAPTYKWPMDYNDQWGDCVVAGYDHFQEVVQKLLVGTYKNLTKAQILALYKTQNPSFDPLSTTNGPGSAADGGMVIQEFLSYLVKKGKILGFAKVDHTHKGQMQAAIYLGLGIITGAQLTVAQQTQSTWNYVPGDAPWGGHCTVSVGYTTGLEKVVSWGAVYPVTNSFVYYQIDEAWFVITQAHVDHPGFRAGFNLASFAAAYKQITGRDFPVAVANEPGPSDHITLWDKIKDLFRRWMHL